MKRYILLSIAISFCACIGFSQNKSSSNIKLRWKVLEKDHHNSGKTLSELTLFNHSKTKLSKSGWQIYFNNGERKVLDRDSTLARINLINGDFYRLLPGDGFKEINKGDSVKFQVLSKSVQNISDYPTGFYIVSDDYKKKKISDVEVEYVYGIDIAERERRIANSSYEKTEKAHKANAGNENLRPTIFPSPTSVNYLEGTCTLNLKTSIQSTDFPKEAELLRTELANLLSKPNSKNKIKSTSVELKRHADLPHEGYQLSISAEKIVLEASSEAGMFYAIQSLKTLIPAGNWKAKTQKITLPALQAKDAPRFPHRAFMMDIARNFQPKSQILKVLDLLALYKINRLHLHFNDDEGWRIAINGLPELTEVGSKRGHTLTEENHLSPAYGSGWRTDNPAGSGFLSRKDFIEILRYANDRHIQVIPEFETPGHARAAIKAMDARYVKFSKDGKQAEAEEFLLRDPHDQSVYRSIQGFNDNIINPALPSVYRFLEKLIDETVAMYKEANAPLQTIHFGGDEVPAGVWEKSIAVNRLLQSDKTIKNVDELWHYYFKKLNALLKDRGFYLSGWEEIALKKELVNGKKQMVLDERFLGEDFHVDVWNNLSGNEDLAYKLANAGYKVVLTNVTNLYLDLAYNPSYYEIGQYWGGFVDVNKPFDFVPMNYYQTQQEDQYGKPIAADHYKGVVQLTEEGRKNIVGIQSPLWSEILTTKSEFEYMLVPKLLSFAERAWTADPRWEINTGTADKKSEQWAKFIRVLGLQELPRLQHYVGGFLYRIPTAGYIVKNNQVFAKSLYPGMKIRFTIDGEEPTAKSPDFVSGTPFQLSMKLRVFDQSGRGGRSISVTK